jgi:UDP-N-acetylglucosamine--N-acetylmuramyl-(pentapeptide) pyrophosphoryl-undecaprenol N-acetylglucosamine transferase
LDGRCRPFDLPGRRFDRSEIAALGRPAILVPYPYAAGDHQTFNARVLADAGAALLCPDAQLTGAWLASRLDQLLNQPDQLESMGPPGGKSGQA